MKNPAAPITKKRIYNHAQPCGLTTKRFFYKTAVSHAVKNPEPQPECSANPITYSMLIELSLFKCNTWCFPLRTHGNTLHCATILSQSTRCFFIKIDCAFYIIYRFQIFHQFFLRHRRSLLLSEFLMYRIHQFPSNVIRIPDNKKKKKRGTMIYFLLFYALIEASPNLNIESIFSSSTKPKPDRHAAAKCFRATV